VVSHIGEISLPKDFGKLMRLFSKDALEDFMKDFGNRFSALDKCEQKSLTRELNKMTSTLVKCIYLSQAYIIE
jgi:hypothetical protein